MMILGDIDANGWVLIIGAVFLGLMQVLAFLKGCWTDYVDWKRDKEAKQDRREVKADLKTASEKQFDHLGKQDETLSEIKSKVGEVSHKVSNGLKSELVAAVKEANKEHLIVEVVNKTPPEEE